MNRLARRIGEFARSEDGPTATEYAVMLAGIIFVAIVAIKTIGMKTDANFQQVSDLL